MLIDLIIDFFVLFEGFPMSQIKAGKMEWAEEIFHISLGELNLLDCGSYCGRYSYIDIQLQEEGGE